MKFFLTIMITLLTNSLWANYSVEDRWSISSGAGYPFLYNNNRFDKRADPDFAFNFSIRKNFNNFHSLTIGYSRYEFDHTPTCPRVYDALYTYRFKGQERLTPIIGAAAGVADIPNYNIDENLKLALRARGGVEYMLSPSWLLGVNLDYLYVSKMTGEKRTLVIGEIHSIIPQFNIHFLFK